MNQQKKETMTSRQRVLKAISHQPVDRMPIDLGMHFSTGISAFAYYNLRKHLGLSLDNIQIPDMIQFLARVDEDILERFHCDCILLNPGWPQTHTWNPRGDYKFQIPTTAQPKLMPDGKWTISRNGATTSLHEGGFFFEGGWPGFSERDFDTELDATAREAERIYKETNYFTAFMQLHAFFHCDNLDWQCMMITDPEEIEAMQQKILEHELETAQKVIEKMGPFIQGICLNADLGSQNGPLCRPSLFDDLCAPYLKKLCDFIHENSDLKIFLHSCGSIKPLIPTLIACGIDVLNPVQISAANMDPLELKKEYGDKIAFWGGGCDTQRILNFGSPEAVAENVKMLVSAFKPNSGFVFNQVHNIMGDVKPENIVTMLDTAYEASFY